MDISACELDPLFSAPQFYSSFFSIHRQFLFDHDAVQARSFKCATNANLSMRMR